jgi:hypothetical protein
MTWKFFEAKADGQRAQILIDPRFSGNMPTAQLPNVAWFGVWCREDPGGAYWSPQEAPSLDAIEQDLLGLCEKHGNGWAVYVRRYATPGVREYYFYFGEGADLSKVAVNLVDQHPGYRIEYETEEDPDWSNYQRWMTAVPMS